MQQRLITPQLPNGPWHYPDLLDMADHEESVGNAFIRFGRFCVWLRERQLLADGQPVELGGRAFDLLMVLIRAPGIVITKNEIASRVWPETTVEEGNLKVQISALRRVLGEDRDLIKTVHGRGYVFTAAVTTGSGKRYASAMPGAESAPLPFRPVPATNLSVLSLPCRQRPTGSRMTVPDDAAQPTVIVIDDDPDVREAIGGLIRSVGLRVELFASFHEFLPNARPDLSGCLVLDVRLPGRSGLDFQDELAKANLKLPIIFISGHADIAMSVRPMKAGAVEFLTKPVRDQDLLDAIQLAIAQGHARRHSEKAAARDASSLRHANAA